MVTIEESWTLNGVAGTAGFSKSEQYRYFLTRQWDEGRACCFLMLNPSTADARKDDPTIRRCIGFAQRWGYKGLHVVNLFALRATNPAELRKVPPIGLYNDYFIRQAVTQSDVTVAAWGVHGTYLQRDAEVMSMLAGIGQLVHCLGTTKDGHPRHPLYVRGDTEPIEFKLTAAHGQGVGR